MRRAFISYAHRDATRFARWLWNRLTEHGISAWFDPDVRPGEKWPKRLEEEIRNSDILLAVVTDGSVRSDSICRDEWAYAVVTGKTVIPLRLDPRTDPVLLLVQRSWADFSEDWDAGLQQLLCFFEEGEKALSPPALEQAGGVEPLDFGRRIAELTRDLIPREWIGAALDDWLHTSGDNTLVIVGEPGVGKSTVAAWVAASRDEQVAAIHFCTTRDVRTLDPQRFVSSVVAQMMRNDEYARHVEARDPARRRSSGVQGFLELVVEPALELTSPEAPQILIVDGLDEALTDEVETIVDVLVTHTPDFPDWLRVLTTTRPDERILQRLRSERCLVLDADSPENRGDVREYIGNKLEAEVFGETAAPGTIPRDRALMLVENACDGNFLVAKLLTDALTSGDVQIGDLDSAVPIQLHDFHRRFFNRRFPDPEQFDRDWYPLLGPLSVANEPLSIEIMAELAHCTLRGVNLRIQRISQLLEARESGFVLYHRALAEWLTDRGLAGVWWCEATESHRMLADALTRLRESESFGAPELRALPEHLAGAGQWPELADLICSEDYVGELRSHTDVSRADELRVFQHALLRLPENLLGGVWRAPEICVKNALDSIMDLIDSALITEAERLILSARDPVLDHQCDRLASTWHLAQARLRQVRGRLREAIASTERVDRAGDSEQCASITRDRLQALVIRSGCQELLDQRDEAARTLEQARAVAQSCDDPEVLAHLLIRSATLALATGRLEEAEETFRRGISIWRTLGNATRVAQAQVGLSCAVQRRDRSHARELLECAASARGTASWARASAENNLGMLLLEEGRYVEAEPHMQEGLRANRRADDARGVAQSLTSLGELRYRLGRLTEAEQTLRDAVARAGNAQDAQCARLALALLALVLASKDRSADFSAAEGESASHHAAIMRLARLEHRVAHAPRSVTIPQQWRRAIGELGADASHHASGANLAVERIGLLIEAAIAGDSPDLPAMGREAAQVIDRAIDRHLLDWVEWLLEAARADCPSARLHESWSECDPCTIFDLRVERLLARLGSY